MANSFLITFKPGSENPDLGWPMSEYRKIVSYFDQNGTVQEGWRFQGYKKASAGERVFLVLQGKNGPAVLGYGKIGSMENFKGQSGSVPIDFEMIVNPENEILATKEELQKITTDYWGSRASGITLPEQIATSLEELVVGRTPLPSNMNFPEKENSLPKQKNSESALRDLFLDFSKLYPDVRQNQKFSVHDGLWKILGKLTNQMHSIIQDIPGSAKVKIQWSLGKGVWVSVPWIALMHADETETTQKGLYCCYLFSEDMSSVALTLSIGATEYLNKNTSKAAHEIMSEVCNRYADYFSDLEEDGFDFGRGMDLATSSKLGKSYEHGVVTYKSYDLRALPEEEVLQSDLHLLIEKYVDFINSHDHTAQIANPAGQRIWSLSIGESGRYFEEFYQLNKIGIGWDDIGDFKQYKTHDEFMSSIKQAYKGKSNKPTNNAKACFDFAYVMKPGDLVFIKSGENQILAYGIVDGDYIFEENRPYYKNTRKIIWQGKGEWSIPDKFAQKTLTDITPFPTFVQGIKNCIGIGKVMTDKLDPELPHFGVDEALEGIFLPCEEFERSLRVWRQKKNLILQGPPGVGKSFIAENLSYALMGYKNESALKRLQFHQSYSYEDFIQGYRPTDSGFVLKDGVFIKFCKQAIIDPDNIYVFIIDEINRGNLSKILGELMVLIEPDKRGPKWKMPLTYNEEPFYVPENLYILGMMNTADRSLSLVDYALRRRFSFMDVAPQFASPKYKDFMLQRGAELSLINRIINQIQALNNEISEDDVSLGSGFCIGHSYFCPQEDGSANIDWFRDQIEMEVLPLLKEYWFDNHEKFEQWRESLLKDLA